MPETQKIISGLMDAVQLQDGVQVIPGDILSALACHFGCSLKELEILALQNQVWPLRYLRNFKTISFEQQIRLLQSEVVLCGAGGIGGFVLEIMLRLGIGSIVVVDGDRFEESNMNRQLLSSIVNLGQYKLCPAKERAACINPAVELLTITEYQDSKGLQTILRGKQICVDAFGGTGEKNMLKEAALLSGVRVISGFVSGDLGMVFSYGPGADFECPFWSVQGGAEEELGCLPDVLAIIAGLICAELRNFLISSRLTLKKRCFFIDLERFEANLLSLK